MKAEGMQMMMMRGFKVMISTKQRYSLYLSYTLP
jgi:hypothetical protein